MNIVTRLEETRDFVAIRQVNRSAFGRDDEARLVDALRDAGDLRASLVAEVDGPVVGHILFSELQIHCASSSVPALALAPMAVQPEFQRRGIGSQLVRDGLEVCRRAGHQIVIVLGHREYYPRFGFSAELARPLDSPYAGDSFMAAELVPGALTGITGRVQYPPAFEAV